MKKIKPTQNATEQVDEFMEKLDHPFKAEVQTMREMIRNVNKDITEQIKWNAPSFIAVTALAMLEYAVITMMRLPGAFAFSSFKMSRPSASGSR